MNAERTEFLSLKTLPARLGVQEAAWYLGFGAHDIPTLIKAGLLKPLGRPSANSIKYFAAEHLAQLRQDLQWLSRASDAIAQHWQTKNMRKSAETGIKAHLEHKCSSPTQ